MKINLKSAIEGAIKGTRTVVRGSSDVAGRVAGHVSNVPVKEIASGTANAVKTVANDVKTGAANGWSNARQDRTNESDNS